MLKVVICGILGAMGARVMECCFEDMDISVVAGVDVKDGTLANIPLFKDISELSLKADVVIDFSHPSLTEGICRYCASSKTPLVLCTTGQTKEQLQAVSELSKTVPVFRSANMSVGIAVLNSLCKKAARILGERYDIEIVEKHHNKKLDAPSGTALLLADGINSVCHNKYDYTYERNSKHDRRSANEIGIHSIRGGTIVGEHEIIFAGNDEVITLSHSAASKTVFAAGAINAARFLSRQKPGIYDMDCLVSCE